MKTCNTCSNAVKKTRPEVINDSPSWVCSVTYVSFITGKKCLQSCFNARIIEGCCGSKAKYWVELEAGDEKET